MLGEVVVYVMLLEIGTKSINWQVLILFLHAIQCHNLLLSFIYFVWHDIVVNINIFDFYSITYYQGLKTFDVIFGDITCQLFIGMKNVYQKLVYV